MNPKCDKVPRGTSNFSVVVSLNPSNVSSEKEEVTTVGIVFGS